MLPTSSLFAFMGFGGGEVVVIFLIVLLLFGGQRMPELARGLGKAIREFKKATAGVEEELKRALAEPPPDRSIKPAPPADPAPTPPPALQPPETPPADKA